MKAKLVWAAMLVVSAAASAQTSTAAGESASATAQAGQASASAAQAVSVSAELTKRVDSKDAKVGDQVLAKTTSEARLADGTKIPKGSKLVGHVTDVQAKSKDSRDAHLAFSFDRAVLKDGRELPLNAMVQSLAAPAELAPSGGSDDLMAGGGMQAGPASAGGGLAANGPGGAMHSAGGLAGGATSAAGSGLHTSSSGIDGTVNGATTETGALGTGARGDLNGTALNNTGGAGVGGASGMSMPVGNLSGVTFATVKLAADAGTGGASASGSATTATMMTGHNRNVSLDSGSHMTMSVVPR